jgi:hypothetical protein
LANTSRPKGFVPVYHMNGSPFNGQVTLYYFQSSDATAAYIGDVVKLSGTADPAGQAPSVTLAAAGDAVVGVVVGFLADPTNLNVAGTGRAASTNRYCWVADSPDVLFEVEVSNGTPAITDVGQNVNHAVGTPSATFARSGATIDMATKNTTATLTFKFRKFVQRPDNEIGASAKIVVSINNHQLGQGTGTLGV